MIPVYEVCTIKYAEHQRQASANFIGGDRRCCTDQQKDELRS